MAMGWNPFTRKQAVTPDQLVEAARRAQVYKLAKEAEAYAARVLAKTKALREELERGPGGDHV